MDKRFLQVLIGELFEKLLCAVIDDQKYMNIDMVLNILSRMQARIQSLPNRSIDAATREILYSFNQLAEKFRCNLNGNNTANYMQILEDMIILMR